MKPTRNIMLDIETLGTQPGSVVLSISAVFFCPYTGDLGDEITLFIDQESCQAHGLTVDPDTLAWWAGQSDEAKTIFTRDDKLSLMDALERFRNWVVEGSGYRPDSVQVWGNGSGFDNVLIDCAYKACGLEKPWKFWNDRDVRTMVQLGQRIGFDPKRDMPFTGTRHNALDDAKHQAKYVSAIHQRLIKEAA